MNYILELYTLLAFSFSFHCLYFMSRFPRFSAISTMTNVVVWWMSSSSCSSNCFYFCFKIFPSISITIYTCIISTYRITTYLQQTISYPFIHSIHLIIDSFYTYYYLYIILLKFQFFLSFIVRLFMLFFFSFKIFVKKNKKKGRKFEYLQEMKKLLLHKISSN